MKKIGFILLFAIFAASLYSATINCYIPRQGATLFLGQTYTITWLKEGDMEDRVRILLFGEALGKNAPAKLSIHNNNHIVLAEDIRNDSYQNFFRWRVDERIPAGEYMIRVQTIDEGIISEGRKFFIKNPEGEKGQPDLVFTGRFYLGNRYLNIREGNTVVITPADLNSHHRGLIRRDPHGNAISAVIPFNVILENAGNVSTGIAEIRVKHVSGPDTLHHEELKPGGRGHEGGRYTQLGFDLTRGHASEMVLIIDPAGKILNEEYGNNRFHFILELQNF